jgi:hypothetical protein
MRDPIHRKTRAFAIASMGQDIAPAAREASSEAATEYWPDFVRTSRDVERWRRAVRAAARQLPGSGSRSLLKEASRLYGSSTKTPEDWEEDSAERRNATSLSDWTGPRYVRSSLTGRMRAPSPGRRSGERG